MNRDESLDEIYDYVDLLLRAGMFADLDDDLTRIDVVATTTDDLLAWLTTTLPAKSKLPARQNLFELVWSALIFRREDPKVLLQNLD